MADIVKELEPTMVDGVRRRFQGKAVANSRVRYGEVVTSINTGSGWETVFEANSAGILTYLVAGAQGPLVTTALGTLQLRITRDGVEELDFSDNIAATESTWYLGSPAMPRFGDGDGAHSITPQPLRFNTLKLEVFKDGLTSTVQLFGDIRSIT